MVAEGKKLSSSSSNTPQAPTITYGSSYIQAGYTSNYNSYTGIAYFPNKVKLAPYSKIRVQGTARDNSNYLSTSAIRGWTEIGTYTTDNQLFTEQYLTSASSSYVSIDKTIDISAMTYEAFLGFSFFSATSSYSSIRITDMWLEV